MCYPVLKITQSLKHGVKVWQATLSLLLFVCPKLQSLEPPYKLNLYERFHNTDSHSWTSPISALKHTYLLHGMASTLRMRTTISSGQWHHKQLFHPCWPSSAWHNSRADERTKPCIKGPLLPRRVRVQEHSISLSCYVCFSAETGIILTR